MEDLDESIDITRQAAAATRRTTRTRPGYLADLDVVLVGVRFERTDRMEDLDESIDVGRQAAAATPPGPPRQA